MSNHGEEFWEHGSFEHGHTLYNEVLHVPLIIKYSSKLPVKKIKQYVQLLDLFPTILSMTGIKNVFGLKGKDLVPSVLNDKPINEEIFFEGITYGAEKKAVLKNGWKLIENTGIKSAESSDPLGDLIVGRNLEYKQGYELYNAEQDFQEKINLIDDYPQIANKLKAHLRLFKIAPFGYKKQKETDLKKKKDDLKSLSYIR